jgi:hypothetical protein
MSRCNKSYVYKSSKEITFKKHYNENKRSLEGISADKVGKQRKSKIAKYADFRYLV